LKTGAEAVRLADVDKQLLILSLDSKTTQMGYRPMHWV